MFENSITLHPAPYRRRIGREPANGFEPPCQLTLAPWFQRFEIAYVQGIRKAGGRYDALHEGFDRRRLVKRVPYQKFPCRRQLQMTTQMLNNKQLRAMTGGENADHCNGIGGLRGRLPHHVERRAVQAAQPRVAMP